MAWFALLPGVNGVHSCMALSLRLPGFRLIVAASLTLPGSLVRAWGMIYESTLIGVSVLLLVASPFLLGKFDENVPNCSLSIRLSMASIV
eukprot:scaffold41305_cov33-Attheya_sp.AAC.1